MLELKLNCAYCQKVLQRKENDVFLKAALNKVRLSPLNYSK